MKKIKLLFTILIIVLVSENVYSQWVNMSIGLGNNGISSLSANMNTIFAGTTGMYLSTNIGATWFKTLSILIYSTALNENYIFAGTWAYGVYSSTNNGSNWTQTALNNGAIVDIAANGNYVYAAVDSNGVYLSTNNGTDWIHSSLNIQYVTALAVKANYVYAGTLYDGIYLSTNFGTTWTKTSLIYSSIYSLAVRDNNVFTGVWMIGVCRSTDNGATWTQTSLNNPYVLALAVVDNNIFAGTYFDGIYISNNNGTTWIERNEGLGNCGYISDFCIMNNYIFAGTQVAVYRRLIGELTGINSYSEQVPSQFSLSQNYPNPFNPTTNVQFSIPNVQYVTLKVYDILGNEVATLINEHLKPGTYEVKFNGDNFASGVYYYTLQTETFKETKRMVLVK